MADQEDQSSKTEEPTEQKLRKARQKGDVAGSREPSVAMTVLSLFVIVYYLAPTVFPRLSELFARLVDGAALIEVGAGPAGLRDLGGVIDMLVVGSVAILAPAMTVMFLAAIFGVIVQGDTVVAVERTKPKVSRISPIEGFKRLFSADTLVEFLKNLAKLVVVAGVGIWLGGAAVTAIWQVPGFLPERIMEHSADASAGMLLATGTILAGIAVADIIWKRARWLKKQRMTLKEVRDEHKDSEGDPLIKAKRAGIRRQRARQRIATAVPTATVVITNPTHFAVALRYEVGRDASPVCVAKGTDRVAARIRELAREAEVPIVENRALARMLHAVVEIDTPIPVEHWKAVAEIIAYVMDLQRRFDRQPPPGSRLRTEI
ncbi:flagellar type III secretion system protein FlhB [Roseibacterium sp. SDUM158016]|uniref:EscU/YscU/HrcU family type III secretion system export apparatus switch protein n=1 Tax=Roseicyclus sediminis TaxID=2980997 RepID=UPI0021D1E94E|nr:flagellar type III secretion system protein FlhB [Roseibacterium sp. SDUM158016]MCU4654315.1 flagellar type III secretion system protein FlhB [Roseibacterium sp. SDUM158016]